MKLTHKILTSTFSYVVISVVGFLGTLYFARTLGAAALGVFALGMSVVKWLQLADLGLTPSAVKRISEGQDSTQYLTAAMAIQWVIGLVVVLLVVTFRNSINSYVGGEYAFLIAAIFFVSYAINGALQQSIRGYQRADVADILDALERLVRVVVQVTLVAFGAEIFGMFAGVVASYAFAAIIGICYLFRFLDAGLARPGLDHIVSLYDYAKYSVLSSIRSHAYSWVDITVLGFFVVQSQVGVYRVAWTLAMFFGIVGRALQNNLFPEVSNVNAAENRARVEQIVYESLIYTSIIPIGGLIGALVIGRPVLSIYGPEFTTGKWILVGLASAVVLRGYQEQLLAALNGLDLPDVTFRINLIFIILNVLLNVALIPMFGVVGAVIATVISVGITLGLSWRAVTSEVDIAVPIDELGEQALAATVMSLVVLGTRQFVDIRSVLLLLPVVGLGAATYFTVLFALSGRIRRKVYALLTAALA
ncbi:polysaccharide biosynthesis C-terminal domain-containing protein [Salinibaculum rarum]|uniref:oligosaccharide flippase family protein n=1 Tax=Salinibaculum rarum TaxID=3058903 RepID=UPI00265F79AB|nr:polysaccharide biosynthesis C-terminal domain-containing protein [Salinibaculum sp. KK48]